VKRKVGQASCLSPSDGNGQAGSPTYVECRYPAVGELPSLIQALEQAKKASSKAEIVKLITEQDLPREALPT
jgi:hypothetical protein